MDASRLLAEAERSMGRNPQPEAVIAEAWQAYELTVAVERLLSGEYGRAARPGGPVDSGSGREPGPAVPRTGSAPVVLATGAGPPRAVRLTAVRDPAGTLRALRTLLGEIGLALVGFIGAAADEGTYWQCIEALDAVDEAKDRVRELTRAHPG